MSANIAAKSIVRPITAIAIAVGMLGLGGCSNMTHQQQRALSGGAAIGALTH